MTKTSKISRLFKSFWLSDDRNPFLKEWDELLQLLIKYGKVTELNEFCVTFNDKYVVWIANHPYASGYIYKLNGVYMPDRLGCSKKTKILLEDFINNIPVNDPPCVVAIKEDIKDMLASH